MISQTLRIATISLSLSIIACSSLPVVQSGPDAETMHGNLYKVDNSSVDTLFIDPDIDFSHYNAVIIAPLNMDNVVVDYNAGHSFYGKDWTLNEKDKEDFRKLYKKVFSKSLAATDGITESTESTEAKEHTLTLKIAITKLEPTAPKDDFKSRPGRVKYLSEGAGAVTINATIEDSTSHKVIAVINDRKNRSSQFQENHRFNNMRDVSFMFSSWARQIFTAINKDKVK